MDRYICWGRRISHHNIGEMDTQHALSLSLAILKRGGKVCISFPSFVVLIFIHVAVVALETQHTYCETQHHLNGISLPDFSCSWIGYRDTSQFTDNYTNFQKWESNKSLKIGRYFSIEIFMEILQWKFMKNFISKTLFKDQTSKSRVTRSTREFFSTKQMQKEKNIPKKKLPRLSPTPV